MSEVHSPSTGRRYSIKRVCAVWQIPRSTVHSQLRRSSLTDLPAPRKRGPVGAATDEELVSLIRQVIDASPFHGEGYRKIWAKLRFQGVRTSKDRVRLLMRENGLQARPGRRRERPRPRWHDYDRETRSDVGNGHDANPHGRRRYCLRVCCDRPLHVRVCGHPRREDGQSF